MLADDLSQRMPDGASTRVKRAVAVFPTATFVLLLC